MTAALDIIELAAQAQGIRDDAANDFIAANALYAFVLSLANQAQALVDTVSDDEYVQRGLSGFRVDMGRLREQLARIFKPSVFDRGADHEGDVVRPILEGVWPVFLGTLPQYENGVPPKDPLLPPTARRVDDPASGSFKTLPVIATVGALWNMAYAGADADKRDGDDAASRLIKEVITDVRTYFERQPPGETAEDTGNPDDATLWSDGRRLVERIGEAAEEGGELWKTFGSGIGTVLGWVAGAALGLGALYVVTRE